MDKGVKEQLRAGFELQIKQQFYKKPEFPFLPSMGCYHVIFPVRNEEHDFGFLILEWERLSSNVWNWVSAWVDNEEELNNYKYKREQSLLNPEAIAHIVAQKMAEAHHKHMMRQKEMEEEEITQWSHLQRSSPKPFLN